MMKQEETGFILYNLKANNREAQTAIGFHTAPEATLVISY